MNRTVALTGALLFASTLALAGSGSGPGGNANPGAVASARASADAKDTARKPHDDRRATRDARRKAHRDELRAKLKDLAGRADAKDELRTHARRLARLQHMRALAKELNKDAVIKRVDALIAKENARFDKRLDELRRAPAGVPTPKGTAQ